MLKQLLSLSLLLFIGCASTGEKLKEKYKITPDFKLLDVTFIEQKNYYCGPATLAMVANHLQVKTTADELADMVYTPANQGTFQNELISATRRLGLVAVPINKIEFLFKNLNEENPILIFQNLGLNWFPRWHYALVIGYDLKRSEIILHSGKYKNFRMKISTFQNTWNRAHNWGLIIVKPGTVPSTTSENEIVNATAGLELAGQFTLAKTSYENILKKWPHSFGALVGAGNISYQLNDFENSKKFFKQATELFPLSSGAWYNYSLVLIESKELKKARFAADKAIEMADSLTKEIYRKRFSSIWR